MCEALGSVKVHVMGRSPIKKTAGGRVDPRPRLVIPSVTRLGRRAPVRQRQVEKIGRPTNFCVLHRKPKSSPGRASGRNVETETNDRSGSYAGLRIVFLAKKWKRVGNIFHALFLFLRIYNGTFLPTQFSSQCVYSPFTPYQRIRSQIC